MPVISGVVAADVVVDIYTMLFCPRLILSKYQLFFLLINASEVKAMLRINF